MEYNGDRIGAVIPTGEALSPALSGTTALGPSILFGTSDKRAVGHDQPECFPDLNLDLIVNSATQKKEQYNLKPFYYAPLHDEDSVLFRQEVFQDLENQTLYEELCSFASQMQAMRKHLATAAKFASVQQKRIYFLEAVRIYNQLVTSLTACLVSTQPSSRGFRNFRDYLNRYLESDPFKKLSQEADCLQGELAKIRYCMFIKGLSVRVMPYRAEPDYSSAVEHTFAKFKQGPVKDYHSEFGFWEEMNHVEAGVLDFVAHLNPTVFSALASFCTEYAGSRHVSYIDPAVSDFDHEIQFYLSYFEYIAPLRELELSFSYPLMSRDSKELNNTDGFDLALAIKLAKSATSVVTNSFFLKEDERIFVVSGPNQGGKTTFARTFGQLHYLGSLGCPVPGIQTRLFLGDSIFTHFEREENIQNLRGKLQDDLVRVHEILKHATPDSIVIMNEIFTSTTLQDAVFLSKKVLNRIVSLDALCVWVTFVDEMASLGKQMVSMLSSVAPDDPTRRTFKVERRRADGRAYAMSIAEKYRVTREALKERIQS
jgi:DNA mismatch repair protein MutS